MSLVDIIGEPMIILFGLTIPFIWIILTAILSEWEDRKSKWMWIFACMYGLIILIVIILIVTVIGEFR
jgi:CHASE1-domain containing sensor protein